MVGDGSSVWLGRVASLWLGRVESIVRKGSSSTLECIVSKTMENIHLIFIHCRQFIFRFCGI